MWELCSVISNDSALTLSFGIIVYHPLVRLSHRVVWSGSCLGIRRTGQLEGTLFESSHLNQGASTGRPVFRTHRGIGVVTTGATPAKNTANAAGALRNALTACNTLDLLMYTWHTLLHYPHGANAGCDLAGVAPVVVTPALAQPISWRQCVL